MKNINVTVEYTETSNLETLSQRLEALQAVSTTNPELFNSDFQSRLQKAVRELQDLKK